MRVLYLLALVLALNPVRSALIAVWVFGAVGYTVAEVDAGRNITLAGLLWPAFIGYDLGQNVAELRIREGY